jgi:osmotically-inducible protein OsmY
MRSRWLFVVPALVLCWAGCSNPSDSANRGGTYERPDNTAVNERDRDGRTVTPLDQAENEADLGVTQQIRQAIVDDDTLSIAAQNVKVVTSGGVVTLRGPVESEQEKRLIEDKAMQVAGVSRVDNQLEVITR